MKFSSWKGDIISTWRRWNLGGRAFSRRQGSTRALSSLQVFWGKPLLLSIRHLRKCPKALNGATSSGTNCSARIASLQLPVSRAGCAAACLHLQHVPSHSYKPYNYPTHLPEAGHLSEMLHLERRNMI